VEGFRDKVAVVTGAASGIGFALVEAFAAEGMKVVLADVEEQALERAAGALADKGADALAVRTDVSKAGDVEALARRTIEAFGGIHVLCNNAGVIRGGVSWLTSLDDYAWHMGVNTWGVIHGLRSFIPLMLEQDEECAIVNTSSQSGITCTPYSAAYCLSKHAVVALSECLYHELALSGSKIQVSVLCPMAVATNIDKAERNRPARATEGSEQEEAVAGLVRGALSEQLAKGVTPQAMAEQTLQAIRAKRFYIFTEGMGDSEQWKGNIELRLDDIRLGRNPTFPSFS